MILLAKLASWVIEAKNVSLLDTLNTPRGMFSLVNKPIKVFLNWNHKMSLFQRMNFHKDVILHQILIFFRLKNLILALLYFNILQVEDVHERFNPSGSEQKIQIL